MQLNQIVNGLIGAGFALAPLNAQAQTQTAPHYAKGSEQYLLIGKVTNDALSSGIPPTSSKIRTFNIDGNGIDLNEEVREGPCYARIFTTPNDTLQVGVYDFDKNRTLSVGDVVMVGEPGIGTRLDAFHPSYIATNNGLTIIPSVSDMMYWGTVVDSTSQKSDTDAPSKDLEAQFARRTYQSSQEQLDRLWQGTQMIILRPVKQ
ncbi:hypothetical protein HYW21_04790 [Candidatus Woesearchaeota archaeon]|nr:hypothetical protein [Candidatus Woesearchaeota archaeon]